MNTYKQMYGSYFKMSIHEKINSRQNRNGLNINFLFATVVSQCNYAQYDGKSHPVINNGLYHHIGRNHSKYPKVK